VPAAGAWDWAWALADGPHSSNMQAEVQSTAGAGVTEGAGAEAGPWDVACDDAGEYVDPSTKVGPAAAAKARQERKRQLELLGHYPIEGLHVDHPADGTPLAAEQQQLQGSGGARHSIALQQAGPLSSSPAVRRPRAGASPLAMVLAAKLAHAAADGSPAGAAAASPAAPGATEATLSSSPASLDPAMPFLPPHLRVKVPAAAAANSNRLPGRQQANAHMQAPGSGQAGLTPAAAASAGLAAAAAAGGASNGAFFTPTAASHTADPSLVRARAACSDPGGMGSPLKGPRLCLSCGQQPSNILLMPGRHIVLCDACTDVYNCPRCGRLCEQYIKVHQA
jgi:hypothetical protein